MSLWDKPKKLFKTQGYDLNSYIGRMVLIPGQSEPIQIETIVPNIGKTIGHKIPEPHYFEINGDHLISMLRFFAQMNGAKDITEDQFKAFEETLFEAEKLPDPQPKKLAGQL